MKIVGLFIFTSLITSVSMTLRKVSAFLQRLLSIDFFSKLSEYKLFIWILKQRKSSSWSMNAQNLLCSAFNPPSPHSLPSTSCSSVNSLKNWTAWWVLHRKWLTDEADLETEAEIAVSRDTSFVFCIFWKRKVFAHSKTGIAFSFKT